MLENVFKAYDVRQVYPEPLNEAKGFKIGYGVGRFLHTQNGGPGAVVCSRDHRPAAPSMQEALMNGIRAAGMDVVNIGKADTSIQYFAIPHLDGAGGVQTTASHNPIEYIGYKISAAGAKPIGADTGLREIQALAEEAPSQEDAELTGGYRDADVWDAYAAHILGFLKPKLDRPLKVFVDCCNGMGTTLLEKVFSKVEHLEVVAVNDTYTDDWAHEPNPLVPENMQPTVDGVRAHGADLGACFDGDADRCMLVDDQGELCGCDHLTAWLAEHFLEIEPGSTIVYDLRSSKVVPQTIEKLGGTPAVSKVGHVNMKAKLRETDGVFGGELSGHFYFKENSFADSGAITLAAALAVLGRTGGKLSDAIGPFRKYPQSGEINFKNDDKQGTMDGLKAAFADRVDQTLELDGVTLDAWDQEGFWFNVRASNTEPLLRLNAEAKDQATLDRLLEEITPKLGEVDAGH